MVFFDIFSKKRVKEEGKIKIIADSREGSSLLVPELYKLNFEIEFKPLEIGDYIIGESVIERKTISDLKSSIIDKRIISQIEGLKRYESSLLLIEGDFGNELYRGGLHENAVRGALLSVALEHKIPFIFTQDAKDSARYFQVLGKRKKAREISLRAFKMEESDEEKIRFILEGFPYIGVVKARKLLAHFHSVKNIINASAEELEGILGARAKDFKALVERDIGGGD